MERFYVAVIIYSLNIIGFKMMFINQHPVFQVSGGGFIGKVYHMIDRQVPDRECFKFSITGLDPFLIIMVKAAQAGGKLAAARTRSGNYHNWIFGFYIFVSPVSLVAYNKVNISRISPYRMMKIYLDPP